MCLTRGLPSNAPGTGLYFKPLRMRYAMAQVNGCEQGGPVLANPPARPLTRPRLPMSATAKSAPGHANTSNGWIADSSNRSSVRAGATGQRRAIEHSRDAREPGDRDRCPALPHRATVSTCTPTASASHACTLLRCRRRRRTRTNTLSEHIASGNLPEQLSKGTYPS